MNGRNPSIMRTENARLTRFRRRVWSGGSRNSIDGSRSSMKAGFIWRNISNSSELRKSLLIRGCRSIRTASSYRVRTHTPGTFQCTGSSARSRRYSGYGSEWTSGRNGFHSSSSAANSRAWAPLMAPVGAAPSDSSPDITTGNGTAALGDGDHRGVQVERVQPAVRVVAGAVRVVGPQREAHAPVERESLVVAVVQAGSGIGGVRHPSPHPDVRQHRLPAVLAHGGVHDRVVVADPVGVAGTVVPPVVAAVVPGDGEVAGGLVERDARQELAVRRGVVVHPELGAPRGALIVGVPQLDVQVVALVGALGRVHDVQPPVVWASGPVPGQAGLGVDRTLVLRGDVVVSSDVRDGHGPGGPEARGTEPVRVEVGVDRGRPFAARGVLIRHHDLAVRPDHRVAVVALVAPLRRLGGGEGTDLAEPRHRGARSLDLAVGEGCPGRPHLALGGGDGGLVAGGKLPLAQCLDRHRSRGSQGGQRVERGPSVDGQRHLHPKGQVDQEDVPELVGGKLAVAAGRSERSPVGDHVLLPRDPAVGAPDVDQARPELDVRRPHDVPGVGWLDHDRGLVLVAGGTRGVDVVRAGPMGRPGGRAHVRNGQGQGQRGNGSREPPRGSAPDLRSHVRGVYPQPPGPANARPVRRWAGGGRLWPRFSVPHAPGLTPDSGGGSFYRSGNGRPACRGDRLRRRGKGDSMRRHVRWLAPVVVAGTLFAVWGGLGVSAQTGKAASSSRALSPLTGKVRPVQPGPVSGAKTLR